jgi:RHS repeat-associated protein
MILARRNASGNVIWYVTDHLGTVRDLANTSGAVQDHISYAAFGKVIAESNSSNGDRFKYTSREYELDTTTYYYRARRYDPAAAKFISLDPIGFRGLDVNLYRYVKNNSISYIDPTGLWSYEAHMEFLRDAFKKQYTQQQLKTMADIGKGMDVSDGAFNSSPYRHFMRATDQSAKEAFEKAQDYVNSMLTQAAVWKQHYDAATTEKKRALSENGMLESLAQAFHTIMDSTSPAHVDEYRRPVSYDGANVALHSANEDEGIERAIDITDEIRKRTKDMLESAYKVYECLAANKKRCVFKFEEPKW